MKLLRLVSLVSSVVIGFSLSGCAGDTGTTPGTALNAYSHGQYWHEPPRVSWRVFYL
ncbi:hypothetical protein V6H21_004555 [Escherichia coli]